MVGEDSGFRPVSNIGAIGSRASVAGKGAANNIAHSAYSSCFHVISSNIVRAMDTATLPKCE